MNDKYSRVYAPFSNLYIEGSPVVIEAGALLRHNESQGLLAQLKLLNISKKTIKYVKVELTYLDSLGRELGGPVAFEYLDLNYGRGESFGSQIPIRIQNSATRAFNVRVAEVGFSDNTVWSSPDGKWEPLPKQESVYPYLSSEFSVSGYEFIYGKNADLKAVEYRDLWFCTCGRINHKDEERCYACGAYQRELINVDPELFDQAVENEGVYAYAIKLRRRDTVQSLNEAVKLLSKIEDYKDSADIIARCKARIPKKEEEMRRAEEERKKRNIRWAIIAGALGVFLLLALFLFGLL